jgi:hypothetical protein
MRTERTAKEMIFNAVFVVFYIIAFGCFSFSITTYFVDGSTTPFYSVFLCMLISNQAKKAHDKAESTRLSSVSKRNNQSRNGWL